MKYFKDANNKVYAYESDGSQDALIKPGLVSITQQQADALRTAPAAVPTVLTMRQARLALLQSSLLSKVDALIATMQPASKIEWEFAATVERTHPLVSALASALPLTSKQLDDLFTLGATL